MDTLQLRQQIIDPYAAYTRSFLTIHDPKLRPMSTGRAMRAGSGPTRSPQAWPALRAPLDDAAYEAMLNALLNVLVGTGTLTGEAEEVPRAVQIRHDAPLWWAGSGGAPTIEPRQQIRLWSSRS